MFRIVFNLKGEMWRLLLVVYRLNPSIRSKLFNYKETVDSINADDRETFGTGIERCKCSDSTFCDPTHGHIITGDLRIIPNQKLRKLIAKGPNFREGKTINWVKCREEIVCGIDDFIARKQTAGNRRDLNEWKDTILRKVDQKIDGLRETMTLNRKAQVLGQANVIEALETLHKNFVLVPIDKASNNVAVVCKKFYVELILRETGKIG